MNKKIGLITIAIIALGALVGTIAIEKSKPNYPIQSHRTYHIESHSKDATYKPNTPVAYSFTIKDERNETLRNYDLEHEKLLHLIVVRKDLQEFQHVHPIYSPDSATFTLADLTFPTDGPYRIFADFLPGNSPKGPDGMPLGATVSEDVSVGDMNQYHAVQLGTPQTQTETQGYTVKFSLDSSLTAQKQSMLTFSVEKDGKMVTNLEQYLGALGHMVVLRDGDLQFIHAHPLQESTENQTGKIDFHVMFPDPGNYKAFLQFRHQGKVVTASFVLPGVSQAEMSGSSDNSMQMMNH